MLIYTLKLPIEFTLLCFSEAWHSRRFKQPYRNGATHATGCAVRDLSTKPELKSQRSRRRRCMFEQVFATSYLDHGNRHTERQPQEQPQEQRHRRRRSSNIRVWCALDGLRSAQTEACTDSSGSLAVGFRLYEHTTCGNGTLRAT